VVPKEAKDELYATATDVAKALHRAVVSVIGRGAINGRIATITIRIGKRADGQATMSGQLENMSGSGTPHAVWSGTAPHHRHATMHGHIRRIINDSHGWLVRNRM